MLFRSKVGRELLLRKALRSTRAGYDYVLIDRRTNLSHEIERQVRERYGGLVFETVIPVNVRLAEAPTRGTPISRYAPASVGAQAYAALAGELEARYGV